MRRNEQFREVFPTGSAVMCRRFPKVKEAEMIPFRSTEALDV
jgi:hypothetical protein